MALVSVASEPDPAVWRNAIISAKGNIGNFLWKPSATPEDYLSNESEPPREIADFVGGFRDYSGMPFWQEVAHRLYQHNPKGGAINKTSSESLYEILMYGNGYCVDYAKVIVAIGLAKGIPVRRWGMGFGRYGTEGHAFNEIWDKEQNRWVFIDFFNGFYVESKEDSHLLSVPEWVKVLHDPDNLLGRVKVRYLDPEYRGFKYEKKLVDYYIEGRDRFFMIWGDNIFDIDSNEIVRLARKMGRIPVNVVKIASGLMPAIRLYPCSDNENAMSQLSRMKYMEVLIFLTFLLCSVATVYCVIIAGSHRSRAP